MGGTTSGRRHVPTLPWLWVEPRPTAGPRPSLYKEGDLFPRPSSGGEGLSTPPPLRAPPQPCPSSGFCPRLRSTSGMGHSAHLGCGDTRDRGELFQSLCWPQDGGVTQTLSSGSRQLAQSHSHGWPTFPPCSLESSGTERREGGQFGRDMSGEERWEVP